jgi:hypothetical protein
VKIKLAILSGLITCIASIEGNYACRKKGDLALTSIELKIKALFLKSLMLKKIDGISTPLPDYLFDI